MAEPWTEDNPGSVELGCMSTSTSNLSDASSKYWNASTALGTVQGTLVDWVGDSAGAWRGSVTALATSLGDSRDRILDGSAAISAYRSTTLSISNRASTARTELANALAVYHVPQPNQITDPTGFADWENDRYRAYYREQDARNEIYRLALERYAADDDAIRGLSAALPDNWSDTVAALASVGIAGVGDLTRGNNVDALLDLAQRVSAGNAAPGEYEALAMMLGMYEHNESVMSNLFTALGGEGTVDLVDAIGNWGATGLAGAAALALGMLVRSGLSTGSQSWTQGQADDFAESMFSVGQDKGDSIGYLFSDVTDEALGETLAIAAANEIDEFERLTGRTWMQHEAGGGLWLAGQEFGDGGNRVSDASGPIFSTLGQYPDSAYEWLTDASAGEDRVDYWYHDRYDNMYWSGEDRGDIPWYITHDGFQGVGDLWFGSQQAEGGVVYPGDVGDPGTVANPKGAAELASRIMTALITGEMFTPDNISDAASGSLAASFVVNLPVLSEYILFQGQIFNDGIDAQSIDGNWVPALTDQELAVFMARVGSHESGAEVLSYGISSYQETMFNMALSSGNPQAITDAFDRIVALQSALDGSIHGQLIDSAQADDAEREAIVSGISTVLGGIPVPMLGDAIGGLTGYFLDWGQSVLTGAVLNIGADGVSDLWATQTENAVSSFYDLAEGKYVPDMQVTLAASLYQYFSEVDPSVLVGIDAPTGDLNVWYGEVGGDLQDNFGKWVNAGDPENPFDPQVIDALAQRYDVMMGGWLGKVDDYDGVVHYEDAW